MVSKILLPTSNKKSNTVTIFILICDIKMFQILHITNEDKYWFYFISRIFNIQSKWNEIKWNRLLFSTVCESKKYIIHSSSNFKYCSKVIIALLVLVNYSASDYIIRCDCVTSRCDYATNSLWYLSHVSDDFHKSDYCYWWNGMCAIVGVKEEGRYFLFRHAHPG